jgi:hypothetical protein
MFYLAAAVSDFYVPWAELAEHKIQSTGGDGNLTLHLAKVREGPHAGAVYGGLQREGLAQMAFVCKQPAGSVTPPP